MDAETARLQAITTLVHWLGILAMLASVTGFSAAYAWLDGRVASGWAALAAAVAGAASGTVWLVAAAVLHLLARLAARRPSAFHAAVPVLSLAPRPETIETSGRLDLAAPARPARAPSWSSAASTVTLRQRPGQAREASGGGGGSG